MKKLQLLKTVLLLCALIVGSGNLWAGTVGTLVSGLANIETGETYYIAAFNSDTYSVVPNTTISGQTFTCTARTVSTNQLTPGVGDGEFVFTKVDEVDNAYYIYNTNLNKYLVATGSKTFGYVDSGSSDYGYWTFSTVGSGGFSGLFSVQHSSKSHYMRAYNNSVRCYDSASNQGIYLFKKTTTDDPDAVLSTTSLAFGRVKSGANKGLTFTVTPSHLTSNLAIACNNAKYTVSPTVIAQGATGAQTITVTAAPTSTSDDMSGTITISGGGLAANKTVTLSCVVRDPAANDGTAAKPYTVAEARVLIDEAGSDKTGIYVTGKISKINTVNTSSGWATYWLTADGAEGDETLEVYQGKFTDNTNFTSADQIATYDEVVVVGNLTKFSSTYEFAAGSYITSLTPDPRAVAGLSWSASSVQIERKATESEYVLPTLNNPNGLAVNYEITGTAGLASETAGVITIDTDVVGTATVTASFAGNASYKPGEASFTITVVDSYAKGAIYNPYSVSEVLAPLAATDNVYVEGYIVGFVSSTSAFTSTIGSGMNSNWAIADDKNESSFANVIAVQISGSTVQTNYGLTNHPELVGAKVLIKGDVASYFDKMGVKSTNIVKVSVPVNVTDAGLATFVFDSKLDFTDVENLEAYIAKENGTKIELAKKNKVPAGTGVLLRAKNGETDFEVPVTTASTDDVTGNLFVRGTGAAVATNDGGKYNYILSKKSGVVGFYYANDNTVATNRAYLQTTLASAHIAFDFDDTTGIADVRGKKSDVRAEYYNLAGQRVAQPTKGLYIVNGKKVIIK